MNKKLIHEKIVAQLRAEVELLTQSARATHAEATDDENKAEDKYDTRGLEASYLAHGQSKAAQEAVEAVAQFQALPIRAFSKGERISLGALVAIESRGKTLHYFVGPRAGGTEVKVGKETVLVITPQSPLGRQILGRVEGDVLQLELGGRRSESRIAEVI